MCCVPIGRPCAHCAVCVLRPLLMQELNVPQDVIDEAVAVVASTKNQVLGLENPDVPAAAEQSGCPFMRE